MKKEYQNIFGFIVSILLIVHLVSCKKFVEVPPPETSVDVQTVFQNNQTATSAVIGIYGKIMADNNNWLNGVNSIYQGLSADELVNTAPNAVADAFRINALTNDNAIVGNSLWGKAYVTIFPINAIIENLNASTGVTASTKKQLLGEAKFMRALNYFYLVNLFGDVPLITTTNYQENAALGRTPVAEVYQQIISDLKEAQANLSETYVTTPSLSTARLRPNKFSATALLARVYLYQKDWTNAETAATSVIVSGMYILEPMLSKVFLATSKEAIFQLTPVTTINTTEGNVFLTTNSTTIPIYVLTPGLVSAFQTGDARKSAWTTTNTVSATSYTFPAKYKVKTGGTPYSEYNMILRLAEQYLIRAEARAQQGDLVGGAADLNSIRKRAGLLDTLPATKEILLSLIEEERRVELFAELGHRWFDLKRTGRADAILGPLKGPDWQATDILYPIPVAQITLNNNLVQNDGY